MFTIAFIHKTKHIFSFDHVITNRNHPLTHDNGNLYFGGVSVGGLVIFDNVTLLTPVLPNLYVTVIGWEERRSEEIDIEINVWLLQNLCKI